jgi:hypothetical protein
MLSLVAARAASTLDDELETEIELVLIVDSIASRLADELESARLDA